MIINKVTFTGADNKTDITALKQIQKEFSFVEWGILIASNEGRNRYPSEDFILQLKNNGLNLALHLCGKWSRNILTDGVLELKYDFFNRYQLNFNFLNSKHDLINYQNLTQAYMDKNFILQYNGSNHIAINKIINQFNTSNTNILFDASGGRGTQINEIKKPFDTIYTGYSGGLNVENTDWICDKIFNHADENTKVWIDMETGVRTNDEFDLDKVYKVLRRVDKWIHKQKSVI